VSTKLSETDQLARCVSGKIEGDIRGAIRLASSDDIIAPANEKTLAALRLKHPAKSPTPSSWLSDTVTAEDVNSTTSLNIEPEDMIAVSRSFIRHYFAHLIF
jgi:hypothetical protein